MQSRENVRNIWAGRGLLGLVAIFYFLQMPTLVLPFGDSFGYLDALAGTCAKGWPVRSDWLEPYGASLSIFSSLVWHLTGSFYAATQGVMWIAVLASYMACRALFLDRWGLVVSFLVAFGLVTLPGFWNESLSFQGKTPSLALLALALGFARRCWWNAFWSVLVVAVANRQSSILWVALPWWYWLEGRPGVILRPVLLRTAFVAAVLVLTGALMNRSFAADEAVWRFSIQWNFTRWSHHLLCLLSPLPLLFWVAGLLNGRAMAWREAWTIKIPVLMLLGLGLWLGWRMPEISPIYSPEAFWLSMSVVPFMPRIDWRPNAELMTALLLMAVYACRETVWPTYWFEPFLLVLAGIAGRERGVVHAPLRWCGTFLLGLLLVFNLRYVFDYQKTLRTREHALVENEMLCRRAGNPPLDFGHEGWRHFSEYVVQPEARQRGLLGWLGRPHGGGSDFPLNDVEWNEEIRRRANLAVQAGTEKR